MCTIAMLHLPKILSNALFRTQQSVCINMCHRLILFLLIYKTGWVEVTVTLSIFKIMRQHDECLCPCTFYLLPGNCTCDPGFGGSDCSFDLSSPPTITHISDAGLCDRTTEVCDDIAIYGRYFVQNSDSACHMMRSEVNKQYPLPFECVFSIQYSLILHSSRGIFVG